MTRPSRYLEASEIECRTTRERNHDMTTIENAVAESALGLLRPETLPDIATTAMTEGLESSSLDVLAVMSTARFDPIAARGLLAAAIRELDLEVPEPRRAAELLVRHTISEALEGKRSPEDALQRIVREVFEAYETQAPGSRASHKFVGGSLGIEKMVGIHEDYDELYESHAMDSSQREKLDRAAVKAMRSYLKRETGA